jgi:hypothetical protein
MPDEKKRRILSNISGLLSNNPATEADSKNAIKSWKNGYSSGWLSACTLIQSWFEKEKNIQNILFDIEILLERKGSFLPDLKDSIKSWNNGYNYGSRSVYVVVKKWILREYPIKQEQTW